jgi:hypothetical protein
MMIAAQLMTWAVTMARLPILVSISCMSAGKHFGGHGIDSNCPLSSATHLSCTDHRLTDLSKWGRLPTQWGGRSDIDLKIRSNSQ